MIIDITCPNCNFSKKVPREKIPEGIKFAKCPRCSKTFELPSMDKEDTAPPNIEKPDFANDSIYEPKPVQPDETGYFTELWKTFTGVLFSPTDFFRGIRHKEGIWEALAFGLLIGSLGAMFDSFWQFLLKSEYLSKIMTMLPETPDTNLIFIASIIFSPVFTLIFMFLTTVVLHFFLFILRGTRRGLEGTFKVAAYSYAPAVFLLIPYVGGLIVLVWKFIILVIGLREVHETTTVKAFFTLFLPFSLLVIFIVFIVIVVASYFASLVISQ